MRSPRLRDTDGTEYDPETGYEMGCATDVPDGQVYRSRRWHGRRVRNWPRYDVRDPLDLGERVASHGAPPDEKQAAAPTMDDVAGMFLRAILGGGWRGRDDDLGVTEEQWEELHVPSDDVAVAPTECAGAGS